MERSFSAMDNFIQTRGSLVNETDLRTAKLGGRFGRLDLLSQLALLAVESLQLDFESMPRERIAICLAALGGSLSTDVEYWNGRNAVGGPSPTLFTYTLPSAAVGELAIRYRLTGPNLCFVGEDDLLLSEAGDLLRRGEAQGCLCVSCRIVTAAMAKLIHATPLTEARAFFLARAPSTSPI